MKIVISINDIELFNNLYRIGLDNDVVFINGKIERKLMDSIADSPDAYVISNLGAFSQKAINVIKRKNPYIPIIALFYGEIELENADIYLIHTSNHYSKILYDVITTNVIKYQENFKKLQLITTTMSDVIQFGEYKYDPSRRSLSHNDKHIRKCSEKEGGLLEVLASHIGVLVKKEVLLEKVWHKSDYFASRSMDVYVSKLRKLFNQYEIPFVIKNISGKGLILDPK